MVGSAGIPTDQLFAAIPAVASGTKVSRLRIAMFQYRQLDVVGLCVPFAGSLFELTHCVALVRALSQYWEMLPDEIWSGRGGAPPLADVGRAGLSFEPQDSAGGPKGGRFYVTWQWDDKGVARAYGSLTRGHRMPLASENPRDTERGLVFLPENYMHRHTADWPSGLSLIFAAGHVRGVGADDAFSSRYFPHVDGVFDSQQRDHDDVAHIKKRLSCALRQCDSLNDD